MTAAGDDRVNEPDGDRAGRPGDGDLPTTGRGRPLPSPERWRRIEALLDAALGLPLDERDAFLDRACAGPLRADVERLLRAHDQAGSFLSGSAREAAAPILDNLAPLTAAVAEGTRVGPYRVVREIGRGGMGAVYLAERDDGEFRKQVALKLVLGSWRLDDDMLRRFRDERQILASLEHPGIARLIDGGVTEDGLPYFIMEYVEGSPIDRYCDRHEHSIDARLALFCAVCDAVQHAHRNGIVHRDLKPSNVLVTETGTAADDADPMLPGGQVKLLDFGVAKLVDPDLSSAAAERTRPGLRLLTPEYASPEQIRGDAVSPASDVYSLGVLLYRLLAGRAPYSASGPGSALVERLVLETWPEPPSAVVGKAETGPGDAGGTARRTPEDRNRARGTTPQRLRRRLRGDLDAIVLKALAKEPARRYAAAGDLAADLRRHLEGRPVAARRQDRLARALALARRHPVRIGAGALAVLGLALAGWASRPAPQPVLPSGSVVAVLPFVPSAPDTALVRLGRDLAVTLGANLDGVGELRTIDILPVLAPENDDASGARATQAARRLGAGAIVRGRLVWVGDLVRADAVLFIGDGIDPAARATATAPPDALAALTDSLTWTLLREVWRTWRPPTSSLEVITTRSLPALRAFLDGERLMMQARYAAAIPAFARAIESDSTFWYAYWRYAMASGFLDRAVEPRMVEAYMAHRSAFPLPDRLLIEARATNSMSVYLAQVRALAERFREYWPAWWDYANRLVHDGALFGYTHAEARAALERTVNLNPELDAAWSHLFWLAAADGDTLVAERSLGELIRLRKDTGTDGELRFYRYVRHLMGSDGRIDVALADSVARDAVEFGPDPRPEWFDQGLLRYGFAEATIDWAKRVLSLGPPDPLAASMRRALAGAWAARGAWDSALVAAEQHADGPADAAVALYAYRLATIGLWSGAVDARDVRSRRARLMLAAHRLPPDAHAELAWLDGVAAATLRDAAALAAARAALQQVDALGAPVLDRSLAAFEPALQGDEGAAARALVELERARADDQGSYRRLSDVHPYLTAVNRLASSRWLLDLGDTTTAAGLLVFHEGVPFPLPLTSHANYILAGPAYLERARLEEAAGRHDVARAYYLQFLRRYDMPVPAHEPLVAEARAAVARLTER